MRSFKKLIAAATIVGLLGVVGVAGASVATGAATPAGILAGLTNKTVEQVTAQRAAGTTYGAIAQEAGKLAEFKAENLVQREALLAQRVTDGKLTQAQADAMYKSMEANQATCDVTGNAGIGQRNDAGFGQGMMGRGAGQGNGGGFGGGMGRGRSLNNN